MTRLDDSALLLGANSSFLQDLYARFLRDPQAVDPSWRSFFAELGDDERELLAEREGAAWAPPSLGDDEAVNGQPAAHMAPARVTHAATPTRPIDAYAVARDSIRILMLIRAYRVRGHLLANLDPLGLDGEKHHPELDPATYGFTEADLDREFFVDGVLGLQTATLRKVVEVVKKTYCRTVGVEFMHIQDPQEKSWLQMRVEHSRNRAELSDDDKKAILSDLYEAEGFERFLGIKYQGAKRFGLEGAESLIPLLETIIGHAAANGVEEIVMGMPHRGRLNVLTSIMGKSYTKVFSEFQGQSANPEEVQGSGDVKYHLGASSDRTFPDGRKIHLSLTANPSHLEAVNPVVLGKVRAKQAHIDDKKRTRIMGLLMHGDAAFAGQGLVAETLGLSELKGYRIGGTIHVIVNNQIGFTTSPKFSRSSPYPSDVAKMVQCPILHVNGDDPEAVVHCARLAVEFRQRFGRDVVIDMFCYRRHGHNESDEPGFTQPIMYRRIAQQASVRQLYTEKLIAKGVLKPKEAEQLITAFNARLEEHLDAAKAYKPNKADWLEGKWAGFEPPTEIGPRRGETAVALETLREVGLAIAQTPKTIDVHRKIVRQLEAKKQAIDAGENIDWATAEALAFGTLLVEGTGVRLSGQDSGRGTFSQRHAVMVDQKDERRYTLLNHIRKDQAKFEVIDSMLSEAAVLGFEYGFSLADPDTLVLWEAQFGDFANGAQVIIDQFLAAGESKWLRMSGLVMLLPHGFEGQGPEHSSARLERYLQLAAEDNMQVVNCTTPANYFHALRRQMRRTFRKPLIVMTPKSLLRHKACVSTLADMGPGTSFHRVLYENAAPAPAQDVERVVLCSGKVFFDLEEARNAANAHHVAIVRLEQLAPFPEEALGEELAKYPKADVVWCQEEPKNMGAWTFVDPRIEALLERLRHRAKRPIYAGRPEAASTATGYLKVHLQGQKALVGEAIAA
ncbi:MAG: 2-oxoglutarate dehydrogenase E1 component [Alphaproteobacteria bacterium]|nr:2-oxoglutarate dehydrogenase E1 component [Alphaproteobacteria bacterium]